MKREGDVFGYKEWCCRYTSPCAILIRGRDKSIEIRNGRVHCRQS